MIIGNFILGQGPTFVIAEACSNIIRHASRDLPAIVKQAELSGANALKVQVFCADHFPEAERESKRKLEFPRDKLNELASLCHNSNLLFGASVFDEEAVSLVKDSGADFLKIATRESNLSNWDLFEWCDDTGLPVIYSFDCNHSNGHLPFRMSNALKMACIPEYPTPHPKVMNALAGLGWSSHTDHWLDCVVAVARNAAVIEKHISFHVGDPEADWSLDMFRFRQMVNDIRWAEKAR